jgi:hypothetical protein
MMFSRVNKTLCERENVRTCEKNRVNVRMCEKKP